uniref:Uncharacterized protein n=1 Tax=Gossypium raimondii TaxID=29730 RepID=A0A0D2V6F8_GOSRA|nr:hypothetical protein B456_012G168200 [Gossypium raimondii]KJB77496.1 hypothetical protein B456_012G168200 [Gossypium raimondii]
MGRGLLQLLWLFQVLKRQEGCFCSLIRLVTEIMPLELRLKFGIGFCGRVHITEDLSIKPAMLAEAQKRSFQGLGAAPNSKCCCGDCERTLLGM